MLEIEQKYRQVDFPALETKLAALGATGPVEHEEADQYFNAPDRDFATTGEAFRLRRIGSHNRFTYKGPRQPGPVKARTELEVAVQPGEESVRDLTELLVHLGYRPVAIVTKRRREYRLSREGFDLAVCLDEVKDLGRFAEVEIVASLERAEAAKKVLLALAGELGLTEVEPRAYLRMVLEEVLGQKGS